MLSNKEILSDIWLWFLFVLCLSFAYKNVAYCSIPKKYRKIDYLITIFLTEDQ